MATVTLNFHVEVWPYFSRVTGYRWHANPPSPSRDGHYRSTVLGKSVLHCSLRFPVNNRTRYSSFDICFGRSGLRSLTGKGDKYVRKEHCQGEAEPTPCANVEGNNNNNNSGCHFRLNLTMLRRLSLAHNFLRLVSRLIPLKVCRRLLER